MSSTQIKICGITNREDLEICLALRVDMVGFNFYTRSPRHIEREQARELVRDLAKMTEPVAVFVEASADHIRRVAHHCAIGTVQLHGDYSPTECADLAREFRVIRALPLTAEFHPKDAAAFPDCDVLLDAAYEKIHGGGGAQCDWEKARASVAQVRFSLLAGGLTPHNVEDAIRAVAPDAVDVCSGVERLPGVKDHALLTQFVAAVRGVASPAKQSVP